MRNLILIIGLLINLSLFSQEFNMYPGLSKNDTLKIPYINENFKIPFGLTQDETIKFLNKEPYEKDENWLKYNSFFSFKNSDIKISKIFFGFYKGKLLNIRFVFDHAFDSIQYKKFYNELYYGISKFTGQQYRVDLPYYNPDRKDENIKHFTAFRYIKNKDFYYIYFKKERTSYQIVTYKFTSPYKYNIFIDNIYLR